MFERLEFYTKIIQRYNQRISDIEKRIQFEDNKPHIEAYLFQSRRNLVEDIQSLKTRITWLKLRFNNLIDKLKWKDLT
jgi:hypothetical protein